LRETHYFLALWQPTDFLASRADAHRANDCALPTGWRRRQDQRAPRRTRSAIAATRRKIFGALIEEVRFAIDSPLEGTGIRTLGPPVRRGVVRFLIDECLSVDLVIVAGESGHEAPARRACRPRGLEGLEFRALRRDDDFVLVTNKRERFPPALCGAAAPRRPRHSDPSSTRGTAAPVQGPIEF
jgi:hypothetical protein